MRNGFIVVGVSLLLTSCASTSLYNWGNYEEDLFDYYSEPSEKDKVVADLVKHLDKQEQKGAQPAPGLFAEAGTFYLLDGDTKQAVVFYQKEAQYWPESQPMMNMLIKNLEAN